jgi:hypothetical protein
MNIITPNVIILCDERDINIKLLVDWLIFYKVNFYIINTSLIEVEIKYYDSVTKSLIINVSNNFSSIDVDLSNTRVCFSRTNNIKFKEINSILNNDINNGFKSYKSVYYKNLDDFLKFYIEQNMVFIGSWGDGLLNKIKILEIAKKIGFKVPDYMLITNISYISFKEEYITKSLGIPFRGLNKKNIVTGYTEKLKKELFSEKYSFKTSFIQKEIKKAFEIRAFILMDHIYSIAIFSQMNNSSKIDCRHYDLENPYLNEPFELPKEIQKMIFELMEELSLNTGSIDFIMNEQNECFFRNKSCR